MRTAVLWPISMTAIKWFYRLQPEIENSSWRPLNFEFVYLSLLTRYRQDSNGYAYVFGLQLSYMNSGNVVRPKGKKPEVGNPRWRLAVK